MSDVYTSQLDLELPEERDSNDEKRIPIGGGQRVLHKYALGDRLDQYVVDAQLAGGANGGVYQCHSVVDGLNCVIKTVLPRTGTREGIEQLLQELERMAMLPTHANVISLSYPFVHNDTPH
ncbi:MAG: hypothetical protein LBV12_10985, partial [Puniceicoccales bacterium]|nr:hypothetical protein [Puniceicoccales bacterium]